MPKGYPSVLGVCPHCGMKSHRGAITRHIQCAHETSLSDLFWEKIEKTETCWLYRGALNKDGYGTIGRLGKMLSAHRISWTLTHGEPPNGMCVLHKCDVRNCVNPEHLFLGTKKDNTLDRFSKERYLRLSHNEIREIRKFLDLGMKGNDVAQKFNVSATMISRIKVGKAYWYVN